MASIQEWIKQLGSGSESDQTRKFGTFAGVFVPTVLTILGAIMYLRLGWVVGNAGLLGALVIILLAHVITISTGLAVSSISTNIRVGAGGAFSIISQSLGLEVGGSISVPLYLAQGVSTALYIFAFAEGWQRIFPQHPMVVVVFLAFAVVFAIAFISAKFASRIQFVILGIVGFSLFSVVLGSFPTAVQPGMIYEPTWLGSFPDGDFWFVFSVFFPAVTGIMAGISLSGALENPRRSIPKGTMSAIGVTLLIYLFLAFWLARVATPEEMITNTTVMVDKAYFSWAVLAGLLGATFSSALGSLLAAPRVMQALGNHGVLPYGRFFAHETAEGEPRHAMLATAVIVLLAIIFALVGGGLNAIAPLITMFFLITYFMLNAVVLIEQMLNMVSFRPTFAIPKVVPLVGMIGCLVVMFLINPLFSLAAISLAIFVYAYLLHRQLNAPWEDVRSGLFISLARFAVERVSSLPAAPERTWSPNVLAPVTSTKALRGSYRFLSALTLPKGTVHIIGIYPPGQPEQVLDMDTLAHSFQKDGVPAWISLLEDEDFINGTRLAMEVLTGSFFRPNMLFLPLQINGSRERAAWLLSRAAALSHIGIVLLAQHPVVGLGQEQVINVWMREQGPDWKLGLRLANLDLAVLLAYQFRQNWNGRINLCMVIAQEETTPVALAFLEELRELARLPANTRIILLVGSFWDALPQSPPADLSILGLQAQPDLDFVEKVVKIVDASCVFVRDSGDESALA
ncbi:MAG: amino acid permease [Chloroflexi bacterium]|nr:amino acid permease [Chloroflexota bacterium]MBK7915894.1 amino acid permease [Chloroflexota bacterium]